MRAASIAAMVCASITCFCWKSSMWRSSDRAMWNRIDSFSARVSAAACSCAAAAFKAAVFSSPISLVMRLSFASCFLFTSSIAPLKNMQNSSLSAVPLFTPLRVNASVGLREIAISLLVPSNSFVTQNPPFIGSPAAVSHLVRAHSNWYCALAETGTRSATTPVLRRSKPPGLACRTLPIANPACAKTASSAAPPFVPLR